MTATSIDSIVQLMTAVLIFAFVLVITYLTTKFTAGFQKSRMMSPNVDVVETFKLSTNKYIQIIQIGEKLYAVVVCKDTVTLLGEMTKDEITIPESTLGTTLSFQEILDKAKNLKHKK